MIAFGHPCLSFAEVSGRVGGRSSSVRVIGRLTDVDVAAARATLERGDERLVIDVSALLGTRLVPGELLQFIGEAFASGQGAADVYVRARVVRCAHARPAGRTAHVKCHHAPTCTCRRTATSTTSTWRRTKRPC